MRQSSAFILALRLVFSCIGCVHADDQSQNSTILNSNLLGDYDRCEQKCWEEHRDAAYEPVQVKINCDEVEDFKCLPWEYNVESIQREYGDVDEEDYNVLCALRSWEKAGCRRAAQECKNSPNIKRCCDDRWYIPYESGPLYNGYLAGCAPEYVLKSHDSPEHKDENCDGVEDIISKMEFTSGLGAEIDYRLLGRRKAEKRGCDTGAKCKQDKDAKKDCCSTNAPSSNETESYEEQSLVSEYWDRYIAKCHEAWGVERLLPDADKDDT